MTNQIGFEWEKIDFLINKDDWGFEIDGFMRNSYQKTCKQLDSFNIIQMFVLKYGFQ